MRLMKKSLLFAVALTIVNLVSPPISIAPVIGKEYNYPLLESLILSRDMKELHKDLVEKEITEVSHENFLSITDPIYGIIDSFYKKMNLPRYITREFIRSLGIIESEDYPKAISEAGAKGWGQIVKDTWSSVDDSNYEKNVFNLEKNIEVTMKYLLSLDNEFGDLYFHWDKLPDNKKIELIAAAYNGGIGRLREVGWNIEKMSQETRDYFPKIEQQQKKIST